MSENIDKRIHLNDIPNNELAKRVVEIALAGEHNLMLIVQNGSPGFQLETAVNEIIREMNLKMTCVAVKPCLCGNFGSVSEECVCNIKDIFQYYRALARDARTCDIFVETSLPYSKRQGEAEEDILARVRQAREHNFDPSMTGSDCQQMLDLYVKEVGRGNNSRVPNIKKIAATIAKLDGMKEIELSHIAEAIQCQMLWHSLPFQSESN